MSMLLLDEEKDIYAVARSQKVTKANELIQKSRFDLTLQQQKIILYLISQISPLDEDFKLYKFSIPEFCRVCGIGTDSGKNYDDLRAAIKAIADKSVWIKTSEDESTLLRWIEKPYLNTKSGIIKIRLDNDMRPFLLQLKANFTSYELIWTLHFKSKYTIRLYELIKSIHFHELEQYERQFPVDELKRILGGDSYKEYRDFKRRVLKPSIEEINDYSDKTVEFTEIRQGKRVFAVTLIVMTKDANARLRLRSDIEKEMGFEQMTLWETFEEKGLV